MSSANSAKWLLLAALLLAGIASAASSPDIPEKYDKFWEDSKDAFPCLLNLPLLNLEKVEVMNEAEITRADLPPFAGVEERLKTAGKRVEAAKGSSVYHNALSLVGFVIYDKEIRLNEDGNPYLKLARECASACYPSPGVYSPSLLLPPNPPYCTVGTCHVLREADRLACGALDNSTGAIAAASYASNDARSAVEGKLLELGHAGADYPNYTGSARGAYFSAKEELQASSYTFGRSDEILMSYAEQKPRYAAALASAGDVKRAFDEGSAEFLKPDSYAAAMNLMAGDGETGNLVLGWAALCSNIDRAISGMEAEYNESEREVQLDYDNIDEDVKALGQDGYGEITAALISNFSEALGAEARGSFYASPPDGRVANARAALDEAKAAVREAGRLEKADYEEDYLARALEQFQSARGKIFAANETAAEAREEVEGIKADAAGLFERKRSETRGRIDSFSTETPGSAALKVNAEREYTEALGYEKNGRDGNSARRLKSLADALERLNSAKLWLSDANRSLEERRDAARDELNKLRGLISRAEKDGMDTSFEREFLTTAAQGIANGTAEDLIYFKQEANLHGDALFAKAAAQFGYLDSQMSGLESTISAIRSYRSILGGAAELEEKFREFDKLKRDYASGGRLLPAKALGNYTKIAEKLDEISQAVENGKAKMVQEMMEKSARYEVVWEGEPTLDEEMSASVSVRLANELPFGTNSSLSVKISGEFPSGLSVTSKDGAIFSVEAGEKRITAYFTSVSANSAYTILLKGKGEEPATSSGRAKKTIISLSERELVASERLEFQAARELDRLKIRMAVPEGAGGLSAEIENGRISSARYVGDGVAEVIAEKVRKGRGAVTLTYSIPNPYSISEGEAEVERIDNLTASVKYNVTVASRVLDLADVPVALFIQNASGEEGVSVRGLDGARARNFEQQPGEGGSILVSWTVQRLAKGESAEYEISYRISSPGEYAESLYSQASELVRSLDESGLLPEARISSLRDKLANARSLLDNKKYLPAISALQGLLADARRALRESETQEDAKDDYEEELANFREERDALSRVHDAFSSAGLSDEARTVRDALAGADGYAAEADGSAQDLDFSAAKEKLASARESLQPDLSRLLSERTDSFAGRLNSLERRSRALSLFGKTTNSENLSESLADIRTSISDEDYIAAAGGFADLERSLTSREDELSRGFGLLIPEFEGHARNLPPLKTELEANAEQLSKASKLSEGVRGNGADSQLKNATLERQVRNDLETLSRLDSLLSSFTRSPEKTKFIEQNAVNLSSAGAEIVRINSTSTSLSEAVLAYSRLANSSFSEAGMKMEQARQILPAGQQYSEQLQNLTSILTDAEAALSAQRYADAAVLSERVCAGAARLISAASSVEQEKKPEGGGFSFQPVYLLLPLLFFLGLGYIYFKKKPEQKPEAKVIRKLEF